MLNVIRPVQLEIGIIVNPNCVLFQPPEVALYLIKYFPYTSCCQKNVCPEKTAHYSRTESTKYIKAYPLGRDLCHEAKYFFNILVLNPFISWKDFNTHSCISTLKVNTKGRYVDYFKLKVMILNLRYLTSTPKSHDGFIK